MNMQCRKILQWQCHNTFQRFATINPFVPALGAVLAHHFSTHVTHCRIIQSWGTTHQHWGNNDHQSSWKPHLFLSFDSQGYMDERSEIHRDIWLKEVNIYSWIVHKSGRALLYYPLRTCSPLFGSHINLSYEPIIIMIKAKRFLYIFRKWSKIFYLFLKERVKLMT